MNTLNKELTQHVINTINDQDLESFDELHYHAFNEDYYIIGYYQAKEWLKLHDIDTFDAIETVIDYEQSNFGTVNTAINSEAIVNMYVYIKGEELLYSLELDLDTCTKEELLGALNELLHS